MLRITIYKCLVHSFQILKRVEILREDLNDFLNLKIYMLLFVITDICLCQRNFKNILKRQLLEHYLV